MSRSSPTWSWRSRPAPSGTPRTLAPSSPSSASASRSTPGSSTGEEEARLTYLGAIAGRPPSDGDAGDRHRRRLDGAVVGSGREVGLPRLAAGGHRPPHRAPHPHRPADSRRARGARRGRPQAARSRELAAADVSRATTGIAVAGTPTSLAAIDQELDPYDPERVHGYVLSLRRDPAHVLAALGGSRWRSASRCPACIRAGRRRSSPAS